MAITMHPENNTISRIREAQSRDFGTEITAEIPESQDCNRDWASLILGFQNCVKTGPKLLNWSQKRSQIIIVVIIIIIYLHSMQK